MLNYVHYSQLKAISQILTSLLNGSEICQREFFYCHHWNCQLVCGEILSEIKILTPTKSVLWPCEV